MSISLKIKTSIVLVLSPCRMVTEPAPSAAFIDDVDSESSTKIVMNLLVMLAT